MSNVPGRSNGLPATRFAPLVDLEPQLADALLEALRDEGVAAYAEPSPGVKGPYGDVQLPDRPTDRVWVDAGARGLAREVLSARMPEFQDALSDEYGHTLPPAPVQQPGASSPERSGAEKPGAEKPGAEQSGPEKSSAEKPCAEKSSPEKSSGETSSDEDAAWEAIIAGWELTAADPVPRWPASEDVEPRRADPPPPSPSPQTRVIRPAEMEPPPLGPREYAAPEDDEVARDGRSDDPDDHFVPPPPPPLPRLDPLTKLAWVGVLGGPLWLILVKAFDWMPAIEGMGVLAICAFIGGAVGLIYRMKDDPDPDPDDGAVV